METELQKEIDQLRAVLQNHAKGLLKAIAYLESVTQDAGASSGEQLIAQMTLNYLKEGL